MTSLKYVGKLLLCWLPCWNL